MFTPKSFVFTNFDKTKFGTSMFGTSRFGHVDDGQVVLVPQKKFTPKSPSFLTGKMVNEIQRRHYMALTQWGQTAILYQRKMHGDIKTMVINTWDSSSPYTKILWQRGSLNVPNLAHPNIEKMLVTIAGRSLTQVVDESQLFGSFSFCAVVDDDETVSLIFSTNFDPSGKAIVVEFETICYCWDRNSRQPGNIKCSTCYGTGYEGGYDRYFNPEGDSGQIFVRRSINQKSFRLQDFGLTVQAQEEWWTVPVPRIKDKDIVEITSGQEAGERSFAISQTTRQIGAIQDNDVTRQVFQMMRLNDTDICYDAVFL